jgi:hypothetical protein
MNEGRDRMRYTVFGAIVMLILSFTIISGCLEEDISEEDDLIIGSGDMISMKMGYKNFTRIEISSAFASEIYQSENFSIEIYIDDNLRDHLVLDNASNTLRIGLNRSMSYRDIENLVSITVPDIYGIKLEGASWAMLNGFTLNHSLDIDVEGASELKSNITTDDVDINVEGASKLTMEGKGSIAEIRASGASTVDLGEFMTGNTDVIADGAATVTVTTNGTLTGSVSGASTLYYLGEPAEVDVTENDVSSVEKKD